MERRPAPPALKMFLSDEGRLAPKGAPKGAEAQAEGLHLPGVGQLSGRGAGSNRRRGSHPVLGSDPSPVYGRDRQLSDVGEESCGSAGAESNAAAEAAEPSAEVRRGRMSAGAVLHAKPSPMFGHVTARRMCLQRLTRKLNPDLRSSRDSTNDSEHGAGGARDSWVFDPTAA